MKNFVTGAMNNYVAVHLRGHFCLCFFGGNYFIQRRHEIVKQPDFELHVQ